MNATVAKDRTISAIKNALPAKEFHALMIIEDEILKASKRCQWDLIFTFPKTFDMSKAAVIAKILENDGFFVTAIHGTTDASSRSIGINWRD